MNKNTKKRQYKHSEAWLKTHTEKHIKKQFAKKSAKKVDVKKPSKKSAKKVDVKKLNSLFEDAKKKNAAIKKTMKQMSDVISGVLSENDQKLYEKLLKKLAFYGFNMSEGILSNNVTSVKVKMPKVKTQKKMCAKTEPDEDVNIDEADDTESREIEKIDDKIDDNEAAQIPDVIAEPADEELNEVEDDEEFDDDDEDLDDDDEDLDEDDRAQRREDRRIAREYEEDCRGATDDAISEAMTDNGDWDN